MLSLLAALSLTGSSCWDIFDSAMQARAASPQPAYVEYMERITLLQDGFQLMRSDARIKYREDGLARIEDDRFSGYSYVTNRIDPGPPELGPYGAERATWLPSSGDLAAHEIGDVKAHVAKSCENLGVEGYRGHRTYHLAFTPYVEDKPSIKAIWIDASTLEIWKVVVSGYLRFNDLDHSSEPVVDFAVELAQEGPYVMVDHVTWSYREPVYSQFSNLFGEYTMGDYQYPPHLSNDLFASSGGSVLGSTPFAQTNR